MIRKKAVPDDDMPRSHFSEVHGFRKKAGYIFDYYKLPLVIIGIIVYIICWTGYRRVAAKNHVLYLGLINVVPSETTLTRLTDDYLTYRQKKYPDLAGKKDDIFYYSNLYLTADEENPYHSYTYASQLKILASIDAKKLDVVLMDKEVLDAFYEKDFLADLADLLPEDMLDQYDSSLWKGQKDSGAFAVNLSAAAPWISDHSFNGDLYLGIVKNSPRKKEDLYYLLYLIQQ